MATHDPYSIFVSDSERNALLSWLVETLPIDRDRLDRLPERWEYGANVFELIDVADWGHLSIGLPIDKFAPSAIRELFWFPNGLPKGKSVHIASSRLSQKLENHDSWFDALRTLAVRLESDNQFIITGDQTTADRFVRRLEQLFSNPVVRIKPFLKSGSLESWLSNSQKESCGYFMPIENSVSRQIDPLLVTIAAELRLMSVRAGGKIHTSVLTRINDSDPARVHLLIDAALTKQKVQDELLGFGVTGWWLFHDNPTSSAMPSEEDPLLSQSVPILELMDVDVDRFLIHWTRRRVGPWPEQTEADYLDDLILRTDRRQHGSVSALARILAARKIYASHELTRDSQPVVCFSNTPLDQLLDHTVFRRHLSRWDYVPYGIAIDRQILTNLGARPVSYGDESHWKKLAATDRPFFQLAKSKNNNIDWETEREWRMLGGLDLRQIPVESALVFVAKHEDASMLAPLSRWPIVVLSKNGKPE